ncbi:MAG: rod shape-determining protein RodA [Flavobacterium sp.]
MRNQKITNSIDWIAIFLYIALVSIGWLNLYSTTVTDTSVFDFSLEYGKQLIFILLSFVIILTILSFSAKIYENYAIIFYVIGIIMLLGLFVFGKTIKGQTNWYQFGSLSLQPSEFVKTTTLLLLAKFLSDSQTKLEYFSYQVKAMMIIGLPTLLILLQPDAGSAMVFMSLVFLMYRFGLPHWYIVTGFGAIFLFLFGLFYPPTYIIVPILLVMIYSYFNTKRAYRQPIVYAIIFSVISIYTYSVDYVFDNVLEPHQQDRIKVLFDKNINVKREGYNLNQSMIAIGSGGLFGKGYLEGTQTKGGFVPEQQTDYIFTTVGEEWGFVGSTIVILLFLGLILRLMQLSNRQKNPFSKVYGYGVACILSFHFMVNISMLIKLFPTIGVPLPYFSYGGSSMWAFTILLFIFLKLDAYRVNEW